MNKNNPQNELPSDVSLALRKVNALRYFILVNKYPQFLWIWLQVRSIE
jgi:hypothetical protein